MTAHVNYEAEVAVLGAVLVDGTLIKDLELEVKHFYHKNHQQIYRSVQKASEQQEFIDIPPVVTTHLGKAIGSILFIKNGRVDSNYSQYQTS
ncbi:hypothetical protein JCM21714_4658 [Gracilibacillus boraciitolerans JCM 21714]|uniref:DNA helicase DnaB-like N-terminal domain-containing protein n=1 Tax=Gracilibacillus boraciitolerans JCM 21714 TaxID=1298598 RepID=W4VPZ9_9BACI|nr:DnaB-like helicase N-terminal domain-containing protein [Gracilibacillus boraciitolerans]GAE95420.1 hypothetical protein JCM21714_4658 [Gracilibacillus boraciitolerans JCM 21714]